MPVLKDFRNTKTLTLPSYPDSKVEVYDSLLVGQMASLYPDKDKTEIEFGIGSLHLFIKAWNFTDDEQKVLPITTENLGFLKELDLIFLLNEITAFAKEGKKKDTSTPESSTVSA